MCSNHNPSCFSHCGRFLTVSSTQIAAGIQEKMKRGISQKKNKNTPQNPQKRCPSNPQQKQLYNDFFFSSWYLSARNLEKTLKSVIHVSHNQVHQHNLDRDRKHMTEYVKAKRKFFNSYILHQKASLYSYFHEEHFSKDQEHRLAKRVRARPTAHSPEQGLHWSWVSQPAPCAPLCRQRGGGRKHNRLLSYQEKMESLHFLVPHWNKTTNLKMLSSKQSFWFSTSASNKPLQHLYPVSALSIWKL